jgi:alanyl-tRNA synthetase
MKFIVRLSSLALISLSSLSPCLAASQLVSRSSEQSLSSQSLPSAVKTIQVAESFGSVTKVFNTVEREQKRAAQRAASEKRRQERLERQQKLRDEAEQRKVERIERQKNDATARQQRIEAYQKQRQERAAAVAAKREQEQKYFESLTPEQQKQYLAQKRAREEAAMGVIFTILGGMGGGNPDNTTTPEDCWTPDGRGNWNRCYSPSTR